ncbi:MAG: co-chaperone GroES [Bacteroidota bacterium]|nr:co-chaperone GroES [Bacteroidota bacterium]
MRIRPLDDRVLVEPLDEAETTTSSGIIIPDTAKEKPRTGVVLAVGTDEDLQQKVKEGNKILFAKYGGEEIALNRKELRILSRNDILAVLEEE